MRKSLHDKVGIMQGRLSPLIRDRIQSFPHDTWEKEFVDCKSLGIKLVEWTIDSIKFEANPILIEDSHKKINEMQRQLEIRIPSLTCDYFMENPFWISNNVDIERELFRIIYGMSAVGITTLVIPLVDNSSIKNNQQIDLNFFKAFRHILEEKKMRIAFEVDLDPINTANFIDLFSPSIYGINYDIGNSASYDFNPIEEISSYGTRIFNVHVKDRKINGPTVRLGLGNAKIQLVVRKLTEIGYEGNYILQTARARDGNHSKEIMLNLNYFRKVQGSVS